MRFMKLRHGNFVVVAALALTLGGCEPGAAVQEQGGLTDSGSNSWRYPEAPDRLRGTVTKYAITTSLEPVSLKLSGVDEVDVKLLLRRNTAGDNVIFQVGSGAFYCDMYAGDRIAVKFDDRPVSKYRCVTAKDGDPQTLYIDRDERFIASLKGSERLIVELPFLADGTRQVEFRTKGLVWD